MPLTTKSAELQIVDPDDPCHEKVDIFVIQADNAGYSLEEIEFFANGALEVFCYGYTWEDVYNAN